MLHVVRQYLPSVGGMEAYVEQLCARQRRHHAVCVLTLNRLWDSRERLPRVQRLAGVPVVRVPFYGYRQLFAPVVSPAFLRRFDVVHVHCTDQLLDWTHLAARLVGARYVVTSHGLFFHSNSLRRIKHWYLSRITRPALRRADAVFAVSGNDQARMKAVGVDSELLRNPIEPIEGATAAGRDLLYLGRLAPTKRVELLVPFLARLHERGTRVALHVVGSDTEGVGERVRRAAAEWRVADAVRVHGFLDRAALARLAADCGFIVSASGYEGFGISVLEGMSVGLLPVMHDNAAFRETHALSQVGLLTDFDQPAAAADAFLAWSATVGARDRRRARDFARQHSWDRVAAAIARSYAACLNERRA